jgi:hypothetical protein
MEKEENTQTTNEEKKGQCGCFEPSSRIGKMMMKKMCGSMDKDRFDCESMIKEVKCCSESK